MNHVGFPPPTYTLTLKCDGCIKVNDNKGSQYYNDFWVYLKIDEKLALRFTKAFEHLKMLSKLNKEKF